MEERLNHWAAAPDVMKGVLTLNNHIEAQGLEPLLVHLVKMRASQINQCAYCLEMHSRAARKDGETEERLHLVAAWQDSSLFTPRERAALAWTEALTRMGDHRADDALFARVRAEFDERETVALTALVTMINTWNRFQTAFATPHAVPASQAA